MQFWKQLPKYIFIAIIIVILAVIFHRGYLDKEPENINDVQPPTAQKQQDTRPQLFETTISSKRDGKKFWELTAKKIAFDQNTKKGDAIDVVCHFFDNTGAVYIVFKSAKAKIDMNTQSVFFPTRSFGELLKSGDRLEVENLFWDGVKEKLRGSKGVKLYNDDYVLTGDSMLAWPNTKQVELHGNVRGVWKGSVPSPGAAKK